MEVVAIAALELQVRQVHAYRCWRLLASCVDIEIEIFGVVSFIFSRSIKYRILQITVFVVDKTLNMLCFCA